MTDQTAPTGDVAAALEAAVGHAQVLVDYGEALVTARRNDRVIEVSDLEFLAGAPVRARGGVVTLSAAGFVTAVAQRGGGEGTTIYLDRADCELVAVIDDDTALTAGWRQHRVALALEPTDAWKLWSGHQGLGSQERFAETIEAGQDEIVEPSATVMLDLAQSFHASVEAKFKQAGRLQDGRSQLVWEEDINASAGDAGQVAIPREFRLRLAPFHGAEPVELRALLRYRIKSGALEIGYTLHRPDEARRDAFERVASSACGATDCRVVEGRAPNPTVAR